MPTFNLELDYDEAERLVVLFLQELYESLDEREDDDPAGYVREAIDLILQRIMNPVESDEWLGDI